MRLWSLHPEYLDAAGLVAVWREGLLALHVLSGLTKGYRNHPQLQRFRESGEPVAAINVYLKGVYAESQRRGYRFDGSKVDMEAGAGLLSVAAGQLHYEWGHLMIKLKTRAPQVYRSLEGVRDVKLHPLFRLVPGGVAPWEKTNATRP